MKQCNYERTKRVEQYGLGNILKEKHEIIQAYKKATTEATTKLYQDSLARKKKKTLRVKYQQSSNRHSFSPKISGSVNVKVIVKCSQRNKTILIDSGIFTTVNLTGINDHVIHGVGFKPIHNVKRGM